MTDKYIVLSGFEYDELCDIYYDYYLESGSFLEFMDDNKMEEGRHNYICGLFNCTDYLIVDLDEPLELTNHERVRYALLHSGFSALQCLSRIREVEEFALVCSEVRQHPLLDDPITRATYSVTISGEGVYTIALTERVILDCEIGEISFIVNNIAMDKVEEDKTDYVKVQPYYKLTMEVAGSDAETVLEHIYGMMTDELSELEGSYVFESDVDVET